MDDSATALVVRLQGQSTAGEHREVLQSLGDGPVQGCGDDGNSLARHFGSVRGEAVTGDVPTRRCRDSNPVGIARVVISILREP